MAALLLLGSAMAAAAPAKAQGQAEYMCDCICVLGARAMCMFTPSTSSAPREYSAWLEKNGNIEALSAEFYSECRNPQVCESTYYSHPAVHPLSSNWPKTYGSVPMRGWALVEQASGSFSPDFQPNPIWTWSGTISNRYRPTLIPVLPAASH